MLKLLGIIAILYVLYELYINKEHVITNVRAMYEKFTTFIHSIYK